MKAPQHFCEVSDLAPAAQSLRAIRHHIHQHPELAYEEVETAALVAKLLGEWGFTVTPNVGGTGVVGTLSVGTGQRSIGLRADMDALPITEATGLPYASQNAGKMHACGHDGHTTMLLGAAQYLAATRNFNGTVQLYFQPAEETGFNSGAQAMINDGLFERFPCDAVFAMHNHPGAAPGVMLFREGAFMSAGDKVYIDIQGVGGHGARPHQAIDPVVAAASIVMALQTIVSRNLDPTAPAVITVGVLKAGTATNVIPDTARLELGVRSFDPAVRKHIRQRIIELVHSQAKSYGATAQINYVEGYPVLVNTAEETRFATQVARELLGDHQVTARTDLIMGSEDFAYMLQRRPGCLLRIGNGEGEDGCMVHNPGYDFNDHNLPIGSAFWARLVERFLN
ncbi:amidohydrolase [Pseudomonas yamanorum]|uniref:M20 aminoacylase family protein n=1 Tax=Pseudomonas yamanorum TaxID=515393 RepID=UPI0015A39473|nr:M20 aminoacylase family protein [Pseudomonas yamanorum]NWD23604.1 amidohydrolase [Pseudomonas yamanorum]